MSHIAVLGGGNGAHAMAADLTLSGHTVRLFESRKFFSQIEKVYNTHEICIEGAASNGIAHISVVTDDIRKAVRGAEVIFIPLPAFTHEYYADLLSGQVEDGQIIVLTPGNFGALVFKKVFHEKGERADVTLCETSTLNYDARLVEPGHVHVFARNYLIKTGVLPANRTEKTLKTLLRYYKAYIPCSDVLDCSLHSLNPCLHLPGCIMNAGRIERSKGEFYLYEEGITPIVAKVMEKLDLERAALVKALGYELMTLAEELAEGRQPRSIWEEVNGCQSLEFIKGPGSLKNRYLSEDIPYGLVPWTEIGKMLKIATPVMESLIQLGAIILDSNPARTGRTLGAMGIDKMSLQEIRAYLGHNE